MSKKAIIAMLLVASLFAAGCVSNTNTQDINPTNPIANVTETPSKGSATPAATAKEKTSYADIEWENKLKDKLKADAQKSKIYENSIKSITGNGKVLAPISATNIPLVESVNSIDLTLSSISIDRDTGSISGYIENNGLKMIPARSLTFNLVSEEYLSFGRMRIEILNNINIQEKLRTSGKQVEYINPGDRVSFKTNKVEFNGVNPELMQKAQKLVKTAPFFNVEIK